MSARKKQTCPVGCQYSEMAASCTVSGSNPGKDKRFSLFRNRSNRLCGPPSRVFNGHRDYFPRAKQRKREAAHPPPTTAEIKNEWSYTSASPTHLHSMDKDSCTSYYWPRSMVIPFHFTVSLALNTHVNLRDDTRRICWYSMGPWIALRLSS